MALLGVCLSSERKFTLFFLLLSFAWLKGSVRMRETEFSGRILLPIDNNGLIMANNNNGYKIANASRTKKKMENGMIAVINNSINFDQM